MHVREAGPDDAAAPPVVLLHGQPGRGEDWDPIVTRLAHRFRVLVPDRPGYGRTKLSARGLFANADAVAEMLDDRDVPRVTVVGHSWGGGVALAFALRHPQRVHALVLAASIGAESSVDTIDRLLGAPIIGDALSFAALRLFAPLLLVPAVRSLLTPVAGPMRDDMLDRVRHWRSTWRSFVIEQRAMLNELPELSSQLARVDVPALVVVGQADRMLPTRAAVDLAAALPQGRLVTLQGAGHLLQYDAPDRLAELISELAGAA